MRLIEITVSKFRNIIDSTPVRIQPDVTCFVGKNESGKTSLLHSLYRLNPARPNAIFDVANHYPAWLEKKDRLQGINIEESTPISAKFEIDESTFVTLETSFGPGILSSREIMVRRTYSNNLQIEVAYVPKNCINFLLQELSFTQSVASELNNCTDIPQLRTIIKTLTENESTEESDKGALNVLQQKISKIFAEGSVHDAVVKILSAKIPKFVYFDRYSTLPYSVKIRELLSADPTKLKDDDLTARALLKMAGADDSYLLNPDYERRKRELENVANALTQDVLQYWSQNRELRVTPDITQKTEHRNDGQHTVLDELKIRIWDNKHSLSLPFNEHSTGFQWFFSFLAAFSEFEFQADPVIILLDEPGLGLHGRAQADFLKFIEERLSKKHQVLYSTHSPFLVQPDHLERARIVEEKDTTAGTKIMEDVLTSDPDTLFPLQGALGYDLVQHLFVSKNNLVVEGTSDFAYLVTISDYLGSMGKTSLDSQWSIIPVGGADLIPTFVALLGQHLDLTVLVDARKEGHQKLDVLAERGYLNNKRIITVGQIVQTKCADIEDLFDVEDYLILYNGAFKKTITSSQLTGKDQIVNRLARLEGVDRFDHGRPADHFLRNKIDLLPKLNSLTLENFEKLFEAINKTLGT